MKVVKPSQTEVKPPTSEERPLMSMEIQHPPHLCASIDLKLAQCPLKGDGCWGFNLLTMMVVAILDCSNRTRELYIEGD